MSAAALVIWKQPSSWMVGKPYLGITIRVPRHPTTIGQSPDRGSQKNLRAERIAHGFFLARGFDQNGTHIRVTLRSWAYN